MPGYDSELDEVFVLLGSDQLVFLRPTDVTMSPAGTNLRIAASNALPAGATPEVYVHNQAAASAVWIVAHNLNMYPNVTTVDTAGTELHGEVKYNSANQLTVTFSVPNSGQAFIS